VGDITEVPVELERFPDDGNQNKDHPITFARIS
jgi:hypothetical protein